MNLNFSGFKTVQTANTKESARVAKGQTFNAKFKKFISKKGGEEKPETIFTISNKLFAEMGLDQHAMIQIISPEGATYLAAVDNDHGTILKRTGKLAADAEKGKKFKSTIIEDALAKQGVIDLTLVGVTQKLDFNKVADSVTIGEGAGAINAYAVYEVVKAANAELTDDEKAEDEAGLDETHDEATESKATEAATTNAKASSTADTDDF